VDDTATQSKRECAAAGGKAGGRHHPKPLSLRDASTRKLTDKTSQRTKVSRRARVSERTDRRRTQPAGSVQACRHRIAANRGPERPRSDRIHRLGKHQPAQPHQGPARDGGCHALPDAREGRAREKVDKKYRVCFSPVRRPRAGGTRDDARGGRRRVRARVFRTSADHLLAVARARIIGKPWND
jgi:hypothetical protein